MYNGIGLTTTRGSATSGHVQKNLSHLRPEFFRNKLDSNTGKHKNQDFRHGEKDNIFNKKLNKEVIEHNRKHALEAEIFELEENLRENGHSKEEIVDRVNELRLKQQQRGNRKAVGRLPNTSTTDSHAIVELKAVANEKMRNAFGIANNYVAGSSFDPKVQEAKKIARDEEQKIKQEKYEADKERKQQRLALQNEETRRLENAPILERNQNNRLELENGNADNIPRGVHRRDDWGHESTRRDDSRREPHYDNNRRFDDGNGHNGNRDYHKDVYGGGEYHARDRDRARDNRDSRSNNRHIVDRDMERDRNKSYHPRDSRLNERDNRNRDARADFGRSGEQRRRNTRGGSPGRVERRVDRKGDGDRDEQHHNNNRNVKEYDDGQDRTAAAADSRKRLRDDQVPPAPASRNSVVDVDAPKESVLAANSTIVYASSSSAAWVASKRRKSRFDSVLPTASDSSVVLAGCDNAEVATVAVHDAAAVSLQLEKGKEEEPQERDPSKKTSPRSPSTSSSSSSSSSRSSSRSSSSRSSSSNRSKSSKK